MMSDVQARLEAYRKELLEVDFRNPLINYRTRLKSVELIDESAESVFRRLVSEYRTLPFQPMSVRNLGVNSADGLKTWLTGDKLHSILGKINSEARSCLLERSANLLYLAMGFLYWKEKDNDAIERKSPLLLIPAELIPESEDDDAPLQISYTGGEIIQNPVLKRRLNAEQGVLLPDVDTVVDTDSYFSMLELAIMGRVDWRIASDEMVLGLFSFGKMQMYLDLAPERLHGQGTPSQHPLLQNLLSDDPMTVEDWQSAKQDLVGGHPQLPADDDQLSGMRAVQGGQNLVVFGPPGTGKSQTISNLIADFVKDGRSVLFVSEKQAALEVVHRRLCQIGIQDKLLELHSSHSNRQQLMQRLMESLKASDSAVDELLRDPVRVKRLYKALEGQPEAELILGNGTLTFQQAVKEYYDLLQGREDLPRLSGLSMASLDENGFRVASRLVDDLSRIMGESGKPAENPFYSSLIEREVIQQAEVTAHLQQTFHTLAESISLGKLLAARLWMNEFKTISDLEGQVAIGWRLLELPEVQSIPLGSQEWLQEQRNIERLLKTGEAMQQLRYEYQEVFKSEAWELDVTPLRELFVRHDNKWWKLENGAVKKARDELQSVCLVPLPRDSDNYLRLTGVIREFQGLQQELRHLQRSLIHLFGEHWEGENSDWELLRQLYDWNIQLASNLDEQPFPSESLEMLTSSPDLDGLSEDLDQIGRSLTEFDSQWKRLLELTAATGLDRWKTLTIEQLLKQLKSWDKALSQIEALDEIAQLLQELDSSGMGVVSDLIRSWRHRPEDVAPAFALSWYGYLIADAYISHANHLMPFEAHSPLQVLLRESQLERSETSIRSLLRSAGGLIQQLRPVFMMSPLTVSHYLAPGALSFDLVVFDEASQIRAVDALGAILRGRQMVICGDSKQLPPSELFSKTMELPENSDVNLESILSLSLSRGVPSVRLNNHYRSRDESLIAVSNEVFYGNELTIRSDVLENIKAGGVMFNYLPHTVYERGRTRTNPGEARAVAEMVMAHAQFSPEMTLGVVTFSTAQRDAILNQLEELRAQNPAAEAFFERHEMEPFFVKHVENVQGDERDVIYISVGYGRNQDGVIAQNFGAISQPGGERRMNVLITRARLQVEVFANFTGKELELDKAAPSGMKALKTFLEFARQGEVKLSNMA